MDLKLKGRTALVTGSTRGIGRSMVELFAAEGTNVALTARNPDQVEATVAALEAMGVKAFGRAEDQSDGEATERFIRDVAEEFGGIDAYISNASSLATGNSLEAWQSNFSVDMLGAVKAAELVWPYLEAAAERHGDSSFIAISSMAATQVNAPDAYSAIKAGLVTFTKGLARMGAPKGVRANTIAPGMIYIEDGAWGHMQREMPELFDQMLAANPTGHMGKPQDVAAMAVFLSSPLSAFTTGANIIVDGCVSVNVNF